MIRVCFSLTTMNRIIRAETRSLFGLLIIAWYAWGWLCDWDSTRDRITVLAAAYAIIFVGCLMDLRSLGMHTLTRPIFVMLKCVESFLQQTSCLLEHSNLCAISSSHSQMPTHSLVRDITGYFRLKVDADLFFHTKGFLVLEVPHHLKESLHPLSDIVLQVNHFVTDSTSALHLVSPILLA